MVDYSRWDKLDLSDDEDEGRGKPRVQKFDAPQQVTIGGGRAQLKPSGLPDAGDQNMADDDEPMEAPSDDEPEPGEDRREDVLQLRALAERALKRGEPSEAVRLLEKAMQAGGADCPGLEDVLKSARRQVQIQESSNTSSGNNGEKTLDAKRSATDLRKAKNGGVVDDRYSWSQSQETVEVHVFVPDSTRAKAVAVDVTEKRGRIAIDGQTVFEGEWEFQIEVDEDPDWEVLDMDCRRVVRLSIRKKRMPGGLSVVVWWRRVLKGDPEIDVSTIDERKKEKSESFAKAWQEAHVQFLEKAKNRKPVEIDCSNAGVFPQ